jgi:hypothetical protein
MFGVESLMLRIYDSGFRVSGSRFMVESLGSKVES